MSSAQEPTFPVRASWSTAPEVLRRHLAYALNANVISVLDVSGGMSPGPAGVLVLDDGSGVFVKAVSAQINVRSHELYRWESQVLARLPATVPAPRLVGVVEVDSWIALVTNRVPGRVAGPPWTNAAVGAVAEACDRVAGHRAAAGFPAAIDRLPDLDGWARLARGDAGPMDPWEASHASDLAAVAAGWRQWTAGTSLCHLDLRADNALVVDEAAEALLVDWGYACVGAAWLDRGLLAADIMAAGHEDGVQAALSHALAVLAPCPPQAGRFVIAQAGMWRRNSTLPPHAGMPHHRAWQRGRARALRPLLSVLLLQLGGTG